MITPRVVPTTSIVPNAKPTYVDPAKVELYRKLLREGSPPPNFGGQVAG
jgi:hypothetical protein